MSRRSQPAPGFVTVAGIVHPIRSSPGYRETVLDRHERERRRFGIDVAEQQLAKREPEYGRILYGGRKLDLLKIDADALAEHIKADPAAPLTALIRKSGIDKGEVGLIPFGQAREVLGKYLGRRPEQYRHGIVIGKNGQKYLRWDDALDELAENLGFGHDEDLKHAIEKSRVEKDRLRAMRSEISELEHSLNPSDPPRRTSLLALGLIAAVAVLALNARNRVAEAN
jgi:hypothetical protein